MARYSFQDAAGFLVRRLLRTALNWPENSVRKAGLVYPSGAENQEYATVKIISEETPDYLDSARVYEDSTTPGSTKVVEHLYGIHKFTASVQFFRHTLPGVDGAGTANQGSGAFDRACRLPHLLCLSPSIDLMTRMGLWITSNSPARDLSTLASGSTYEDRGSIDLTFVVVNRESVELETLASASMDLFSQWPGGRIETNHLEVEP